MAPKSYAVKRRSRPPSRGGAPADDPTSASSRVPHAEPVPPDEAQAVFARSWYGSSLDLRDGLEVIEEVSLDTLPAELADQLKPRSEPT